MIEMFVVVGIVGLLAAIIGALIALRIQLGYLRRIQVQHRAWERAQEAHRENWEVTQSKRVAELETRLTTQVKHVQKTWEEWEAKDEERIHALTKQFEEVEAKLRLEHELARLPHIEDAPLTPLTADATRQHQHTFPKWRPPMLQGANLSEHDLSHRYLRHADLRNAQLVNTNFFMADLSDALLTGANLAGTDLSGANLVNADLRGATLTGANLQLADLHGAVLVGANLAGVRNVTPEQIYPTVYDSTTQFDTEAAIILPHIEKVSPDGPGPISEPAIAQTSLDKAQFERIGLDSLNSPN